MVMPSQQHLIHPCLSFVVRETINWTIVHTFSSRGTLVPSWGDEQIEVTALAKWPFQPHLTFHLSAISESLEAFGRI